MRRLRKLRDRIYRLRYCGKGAPVMIGGFSMRLDEQLRRWDLNSESALQEAMSRILRPGDIFIDVGANFGVHTLLGAKLVGNAGRVYAIEPVPASLTMLRRNLKLNDIEETVTIIAAAATDDQVCEVSMTVPNESVAVRASITTGSDTVSLRAKAIRLDDCGFLFNGRLRAMKIDVEGAELKVLQGARKLLQHHKPVLLIEVHGFALPFFGGTVAELQSYLRGFGYCEHRISGVGDDYYQAMWQCEGDVRT